MTNNARYLLCILICHLVIGLASPVSAREWNDVTGKHQFKADLVRVSEDLASATMVGSDGRQYDVPLAALSKSDQDYVVAFVEESRRQVEKEAALKSKKKAKGSKSWSTDVPEEVLFEMKQEAVGRFPYDKDEQLAFINRSVKRYLGQQNPKTKPVMMGTKSKTRSSKSGKSDERAKKSVLGAETQEDKGVPTAVVEMLTKQSKAAWPKDHRRQIEFVKKQLGYYYVLQEFETPDLPELVVIQLKHNASKIAPTDYKEQLRYVYDQVQVGREYLAKQDATQNPDAVTESKN